MRKLEKKELCCGCHACAEICPKNCIVMKPDEEGFLYPVTDLQACADCGLCEKVCPVFQKKDQTEALDRSERKPEVPECCAAVNLNEEERAGSSSGGFFPALAKEIIKSGGVVYGAAFSEDFKEVLHRRIDKEKEISLLQGSKYVQSKIGDSYRQVKEDLILGRQVLFTGTPCQVEGLKKYLSKDYENLLTVDSICHGVPSPKVWKRYVEYREKKAGAVIKGVSFRKKDPGWKSYSLEMRFDNGKVYRQIYTGDLYMRAFTNDSSLRPSCYQCRFKQMNRVSDITMADFWGIQEIMPQMDDDRGTSLIIVHSQKGKEYLEHPGLQLKLQKAELLKAIQSNPSMLHASEKPAEREAFFAHINQLSFERLVRQYSKSRASVKDQMLNAIRRTGIVRRIRKILKKSKKSGELF